MNEELSSKREEFERGFRRGFSALGMEVSEAVIEREWRKFLADPTPEFDDDWIIGVEMESSR